MGKKKKRAESEAEAEQENKIDIVNGDSHKKDKKKKHKFDKAALIPTVSVAVPGSIIHNAQSLELATRVFSLSVFSPSKQIIALCFSFHFLFSFLIMIFCLLKKISVGWSDCSCHDDFPNRRGFILTLSSSALVDLLYQLMFKYANLIDM